MKIVDIAQEIYSELGNPSDMSIPPIASWLRANIGLLNTRINKSFTISDADFELTPAIGLNEEAIFKLMYYVHYFNFRFLASMGAASTDSVLEVSDGGGTVRKINKNELSKTWLQGKKDATEALDKMIRDYLRNDVKPLQVAGDDTVAGSYTADRFFDLRPYNRVQ